MTNPRLSHCDRCGTAWFSNDGRCHLCRVGYYCRCPDPASHKQADPAGCFFIGALLVCIVAVALIIVYFWQGWLNV